MFVLLFLCYVFLTSCGLLFIKLGGTGTSLTLVHKGISIQCSYQLILGLCCYIISFLLFTIILQKKELSVIYPISAGVVNIASVLMGVFILKEKISTTSLIGVMFTILGIVLLNVKK